MLFNGLPWAAETGSASGVRDKVLLGGQVDGILLGKHQLLTAAEEKYL